MQRCIEPNFVRWVGSMLETSGDMMSPSNFLLSVLSLISTGAIDIRAESSEKPEFAWKPGAWGECWHQTCGRGGQQMRPLVCAHRSTGQPAETEALCSVVEKPPAAQDCFRICDHHAYMYRWTTGPWSPCQSGPGLTLCLQEYGTQKRNVTCVEKCGNAAISDDVCARFFPPPPSQRVCRLDCPRDCVVTDFGPLAGCESCWSRWKIRHRNILLGPSGGGRNCTDLFEATACPEREECQEYRHTNYKYRLGPWSDCTAFYSGDKLSSRGFRSVLGQRRRTMDCVDVSGQIVDRSFCSHTRKPSTGELCVLSQQICDGNPNSDWTGFGQSQYAAQSRDLKHADSEEDVAGSAELREYPGCVRKQILPRELSESGQENCDKFRWIIGEWGSCATQHPSDTCGTGVQIRTLLCVTNADAVPVSDDRCVSEPPTHTRLCSVACPLDCVVSEWTTWSECLPDRCRLERNKSKEGYRQRIRSVARTSQNNGSTCPHLHETQPCDYPPCYTWKTTPSGECKLKYPDMQCGEGLRNRTSDCISILGGVVSSRLCFDSKPTHLEVCYLPCANDCVTSDWSEWSQCSRSCGAGRVVGYRSRFRDVLASAGQDGTPCPPVRMLIEKERCAETPCFTFHWQTTEWSECRQPAEQRCEAGNQCPTAMTSSTDMRNCGPGIQTRDVYCFKSTGEKLPAKKCVQEEIPMSWRNCSVSCPVECIVSEYTEWSSCSVSCISDETEFLPMHWRYRFVLRPPSFGASGCPSLKEQRPCMNLVRCARRRWQVSEWSQCMFYSHTDKCGNGYKAREVRCIGEREEYVANDQCVPHLGQVPEVTQQCRVNCDQDVCKFSEWTSWNICTERCNGFQTRTRSMEGTTSRIADCYDRFKYPLEEQRPCACAKHTVQLMGLWSHCLLEPDPAFTLFLHQRSIGQRRPGQGYCGVGKRSHAVVCVGSQGQNVSARVCTTSDFMDEMCFVSCPRDCQMSSWSDWSSCRTEDRCGNGLQTRSRYVIEPSLDGGRDCPALIDGEEHQTIPCHVSCENYRWHVAEWTVCTPTATMAIGSDCGAGLQSRTVRCIKVGEEADDQEVEEHLCDKMSRPFEINYCHVPCPGQCVVSNWSSWSVCTTGCVGSARRRRTRAIIRQTAKGSGTVCPHLEEFERCDSGPGCHSYSWRWSNWSICIPYGRRDCGAGRRIRYGECSREDGIVTSRILCASLPETVGLPSMTISEESCKIPCPVDCVVSEWTPWTPCSLTCGQGVQTRTRSVIVTTQHRGRHCPDPLVQHRYCAYEECFQWRLSDWEPCFIEGNSCGYGTQSRSLSCIRHDGMIAVDEGLCDIYARPYFQLKQGCLIACPSDCQVSDWSSWGPCHRPCDAGPSVEGSQTRSRVVLVKAASGGAICPSDVIETRPCIGGYCPTYSWHASFWSSDSRYVWCQRSDGLIVHGACKESEKPYAIRTCNPPCLGVHTLCVDGNSCACEIGHEAVYIDGRLIRCDRIRANRSQTDESSGPIWIYVIFGASFVLVISVVIIIFAIGRAIRNEKQSSQMDPGSNSNQKMEVPGGNGIVIDAVSPELHNYMHYDERYMRSQTPCTLGNQRDTTTPSLTAWQTQGRIRKPTNTRIKDICGHIPVGQS